MTDQTQTLETFEEGGSITARKMRRVAAKIDTPKLDGRLLSPYRNEAAR